LQKVSEVERFKRQGLISMGIEIPAEIQNAITPQFQGANNGPQLPGTSLPPAPSPSPNMAVPAPDLGNGVTAPAGGFAAQIMSAAQKLGIPTRPDGSAEPGAWSKTLVGGAVSALSRNAKNIQGAGNAIAANLGDASHSNDVKGGGWLSGVTSTLAAHGQRVAQEKQQQFENDQKSRTNDALIAHTQAETAQLQRNIYQQDADLRDRSYASNAKFVDSMRADHDVQDNISQTELEEMVKRDPKYLQTHYGRATGQEPVLDGNGKPKVDANGNQVMSPTWSLVSRTTKDGAGPGTVEIDQAKHDFMLENTGNDIQVGTKMPLDQYANVFTTAQKVADSTSIINKNRADKMQADLKAQLQPYLQDGEVSHALASVPGNPLLGLQQAQGNIQQHMAVAQQQLAKAQQSGDQGAIQQAQQTLQGLQETGKKLDFVANNGFSDKDKQEFAKQQETERHDRAEESQKRAELAQKKVESNFVNPSGSVGLTGDAYLKTLPQPQQQLLTSIAEGRNLTAAIQNRKGELTPVGQALVQAYPDFDITKVKDYQKVRTDFTSGATSKALTAYGTAINHMRSLYDTTDTASYIPGTDSYKRYNQDITYVATEVAKALNPTGVATEGAIKEQEAALRSTFNRKAAIENAEHILTGKMAETKQRWANAQVRPSYQPPMPGLSQQAMDNADYIRNRGVAPQQGQRPAATPQPQQAPKGYTHSAVLPGTNTTVYAMPDGSIVDAQGGKYDANGKKL
jgi:hypothetical protein